MQKLLLELCSLNGPSGFEHDAAAFCEKLLKNYSGDVRRDRMGNVIAHIPCGKKDAKKLMLDAHIDEIGMIVCAHDKGFLRFETLGGIDARMLPGREVLVLTDEGPLFGAVACLPPHLLSRESMEKTIPIKDMYIDTGFSEEEAKKRIPVGTPIVFRDNPRGLLNDVICGKAMDDRACLAAIVGALDILKGKKLDVDLIINACVQEEVGLRGAKTAAFATDPDYCIVVDVTHAITPDSKKEVFCKLGEGPEISIGPNADRLFTKHLQQVANKLSIPHQLGIHSRDSGTNAHAIQVSRAGVITAILGMPLCYMHSPVETVSLADAENTAKLIAAVIESFEGGEPQ